MVTMPANLIQSQQRRVSRDTLRCHDIKSRSHVSMETTGGRRIRSWASVGHCVVSGHWSGQLVSLVSYCVVTDWLNNSQLHASRYAITDRHNTPGSFSVRMLSCASVRDGLNSTATTPSRLQSCRLSHRRIQTRPNSPEQISANFSSTRMEQFSYLVFADSFTSCRVYGVGHRPHTLPYSV